MSMSWVSVSLAGFQVTISGRFWVTPEAKKEDVMLAEFFESPLRVQELRDGPDGRLLEGFAQELCQAGYAEITARRHIRAAEHLIHWTGRKRTPIATLDERFVEDFVHHLDRCRCPRYGLTHRLDLQNGVRLFFGYLRRTGVLMAPITEESIEDPPLLVSFCRWMRQQGGPAMPPSTTTAFPCAIC